MHIPVIWFFLLLSHLTNCGDRLAKLGTPVAKSVSALVDSLQEKYVGFPFFDAFVAKVSDHGPDDNHDGDDDHDHDKE